MKKSGWMWVAGCWAAACGVMSAEISAEGRQIYQSDDAQQCIETVRSKCAGTVMAVFVKEGDQVSKGQVLGHVELEKAKLDYDVARLAMESKANVKASENQANAWKVNREEVEEAVKKRKMDSTRLDWAIAMEGMYRASYEAQLDVEKNQELQYEYCKEQYEMRFFRAGVDGVVTKVRTGPGAKVNPAEHLFTVSQSGSLVVPVKVPAEIAERAAAGDMLPVRIAGGKIIRYARVDEKSADPMGTGGKVLRLLVDAADFPAAMRKELPGKKFDVAVPE